MCEVTVSREKDALRAKLSCELDHHAAKTVRQRIDDALAEHRPRRLILDFGSVPFMDSSGIGLILGRVTKAAAIGASVSVCGLSPTLMRLVKLSGLDRIRGLELIASGNEGK